MKPPRKDLLGRGKRSSGDANLDTEWNKASGEKIGHAKKRKLQADSASVSAPTRVSCGVSSSCVANESQTNSDTTSSSNSNIDLFSRVELALNLYPKGIMRTAVTPRDLRQLLQWTVPSSIPLVEAPEVFLLRNRSAVRHVLYLYVEGWSYDLLSGAVVPSEDALHKMLLEESEEEARSTENRNSLSNLPPSRVKGSRTRHEQLLRVALWRLQRNLSSHMLGDIRRSTCWAREAPPLDSFGFITGNNSHRIASISLPEKVSRNAVQCAPLVVHGSRGVLEKEIFWTSSSSDCRSQNVSGVMRRPCEGVASENVLPNAVGREDTFSTFSFSKTSPSSSGVRDRFKIAMKLHLNRHEESVTPVGQSQLVEVSPCPPLVSLVPSCSPPGTSTKKPTSFGHLAPLQPGVILKSETVGLPPSTSKGFVDEVSSDTKKEIKKKEKESLTNTNEKDRSIEEKVKVNSHSEDQDVEGSELAKINATYWRNSSLLRSYSLRYPDNIDKLLELGFVVAPPAPDPQQGNASSNEEDLKEDEENRSTLMEMDGDKKTVEKNNGSNTSSHSQLSNSTCSEKSSKSAAYHRDCTSGWRWFPDPPCLPSTAKDDQDKENKVEESFSTSDGALSEKSFPSVVALDCEMVLVEGNISALARATLLNACNGDVLVDMLVKPSQPIVNYVTRYSGITEAMLKNVTNTLADCQESLFQYIHSNSFLVGHSLENDLKACQLLPNCNILDSAYLFPHPAGPPMKNALRFLVQRYFGFRIQEGAHDSTEDAWSSAQLVLLKLKNGPFFGVPRRKSVLCSMASACCSTQESASHLSVEEKANPHKNSNSIPEGHLLKNEEKSEFPTSASSFSHWWGHFTLVDAPESMAELLPLSGSATGLGAINTISARNDDDAVRKGIKALQKAALACLIPSLNGSAVPLPLSSKRTTLGGTIGGKGKKSDHASGDNQQILTRGNKEDGFGNKKNLNEELILNAGKHYHFCWVHLTQNINPFLLSPSAHVIAPAEQGSMAQEAAKGISPEQSKEETEVEGNNVDDDEVWLQEQVKAYERLWHDAIEKTNQRVLRLVEACPDDTVVVIMSGREPVYQPPSELRETQANSASPSLLSSQRCELHGFQSVPCLSGFRGAVFSFVKDSSAPGPAVKPFLSTDTKMLTEAEGFHTLTDSSSIKKKGNKLPDPPACQPQ